MRIIFIDLIPTFISLVTVMLFYKRLQPKWLRLFLYFLVFTLAIEIGGAAYSHFLKRSNHFIINIYIPVNFGFSFFLYYKTFENKRFKTIIAAVSCLYILFFLFNIIFIEGFYSFNIYSFCLGSILLIICCLVYFTTLFTDDRLINYFSIPMFWISTGLLFFYTGSLVQMSLMEYIIKNNFDPDGFIYQLILVTLNILLYGCITVGLLCNQWTRKK